MHVYAYTQAKCGQKLMQNKKEVCGSEVHQPSKSYIFISK